MTSKASRIGRKSLVADARDALETCAGANARMAARRISQFLDAQMQASGMSLAQFALMSQIAAATDDTLAALAVRSGLEQSTLSRNLQVLERQGLVELTSVEGDMRRRAVWLTEAGARKLEAAIPVWKAAHDALAEVVDPGLARRLAAQTRKLKNRD